MILSLWLTLTHFFDYKPDLNIKFLGDSTKKLPGHHIVVVHRTYRIKGGEDFFLSDVLIPTLMSLNISFEVVGLPALFSQARYKVIDTLEVLFLALGFERLRPSYLEVSSRLKKIPASHVIFNNTIPTLSLALPSYAKGRKLKTLMWVHNSRFHCANGLAYNGKTECHKCLTKGSRWALFQKCLPSWSQSLVYAWIYRRRRVSRFISAGVDQYLAVSNYSATYVKETLKSLGVDAESPERRVDVIRHPAAQLHSANPHRQTGGIQLLVTLTKKIPAPFYAFIGRLSFEKGADLYVELARKFPERGFLLCGEGPLLEKLKSQSPKNLVITGFVGHDEKEWIFSHTEALIIPSRVPETSSLIIGESHPFGTPIVYPKGGGAEETFHFLKRSGCSIEEFSGQKFKRTEPESSGDEEPLFTKNLREILNS